MAVGLTPLRGTEERDMAHLLTLLKPDERSRVEVAGHTVFHAHHTADHLETQRALRQRVYHALIISLTRHREMPPGVLMRLVREYPRMPVLALYTGTEGVVTQQLLQLGQSGVRLLIDARYAEGWRDLRGFMGRLAARGIEARALERLQGDLVEASPQTRRFFETLFLMPPTMSTIRELSDVLGVRPTTFMSRFFRARLPAPKQYLIAARLVRAAYLLENPGCSVSQVATHLNYSSPQSFSRHVQSVLQCGAAEFRRRFDGESMLIHLRERLVLPYREAWRGFDPFSSQPSWVGGRPLVMVREPTQPVQYE